MKNLKIWSLVAVMLMVLVGCNNGDKPTPSSNNFDGIENEWKLISVNGVANEFTVYIKFEAGNFAMYQQIYTFEYKFYDGEYKISGGKLTGEYYDDGAWKCGYTGGVSEDGKTLTLKSDDKNAITCVYEACTIPEEVMEEALSTRSVDVVPFL